MHVLDLADAIMYMVTSPCNKYMVVADCLSNVVIWENKNNKWIKYCKLPKYDSLPTGIGIQAKSLLLVVAYADQKVKNNVQSFNFNLKIVLFFS